MRIGFNFHSADNYISGVEYYSLGLLRTLLDIDNENQYLVFTNKAKIIESHIGLRDNLTIKDCGFLRNRLHRIFWEQLILPSIVKKENLDILHCTHYICPAIKRSVAYVITIHDTIAIDNPRWCKRSNATYYNIFMKWAITAASKIISVSKFTSERIRQNFNINDSKVKMIHPGIDDDIFNLHEDIERQQQIRVRYKLPEKYILYSGNIEPKKNILNLLKAFKLLKNDGIKHTLVITGKRTWRSENVFNFIHTEFDHEDVVLTGYIDRCDMGIVYKMADCLVLPSFCEGFGFPVAEAFACGVPVASSCVGILKEIDKQAYTYIDPYNPAQIAKAVNSLLTEQTLREQQIKEALAVVSKFNWGDCAVRTLELYREVIETNG